MAHATYHALKIYLIQTEKQIKHMAKNLKEIRIRSPKVEISINTKKNENSKIEILRGILAKIK